MSWIGHGRRSWEGHGRVIRRSWNGKAIEESLEGHGMGSYGRIIRRSWNGKVMEESLEGHGMGRSWKNH